MFISSVFDLAFVWYGAIYSSIHLLSLGTVSNFALAMLDCAAGNQGKETSYLALMRKCTHIELLFRSLQDPEGSVEGGQGLYRFRFPVYYIYCAGTLVC